MPKGGLPGLIKVRIFINHAQAPASNYPISPALLLRGPDDSGPVFQTDDDRLIRDQLPSNISFSNSCAGTGGLKMNPCALVQSRAFR